MSAQATPEEIAFVVADAQTWPDAYVARRVVLHLDGEVAALRRQVEELREIELSEECRGLLTAHGSDGTILVCGEFTNGREFSQKFRARALRSGEAVATPPPSELTVHDANEEPTESGWYECWATDDRWSGEMR